MPVGRIDVESTTVAITSIVSALITFGFCASDGVRLGESLAIAAAIGIALYFFGVIPIGLLAVIGFGMICVIFKRIFGGNKPPD